jgi:hypothetical protein
MASTKQTECVDLFASIPVDDLGGIAIGDDWYPSLPGPSELGTPRATVWIQSGWDRCAALLHPLRRSEGAISASSSARPLVVGGLREGAAVSRLSVLGSGRERVDYRPAAAWRLDDCTAEEAAERLPRYRALLSEYGIARCSTAAAAGLRLALRTLPAGERGQVPEDCIGPCAAAFVPGPMILHAAGWAPFPVVSLDRNRAYLQALHHAAGLPSLPTLARGPVPGWAWIEDHVLERGGWGLIEAEIELHSLCDGYPTQWGPLPVAAPTGGRWWPPAGRARGWWPAAALSEAVGAGQATVIRVHDAVIAATLTEWPQRLADEFEEILNRDISLGKALYTSWWAAIGSRGWGLASYEGLSAGLSAVWRVERAPALPGVYRPDITATICGRNTQVMGRAISSAPYGSIVSAMVDYVAFDGRNPGFRPASLPEWGGDGTPPHGWKVAGRGDYWAAAIGCYRHGSAAKAMGKPAGEDARDWLASLPVPPEEEWPPEAASPQWWYSEDWVYRARRAAAEWAAALDGGAEPTRFVSMSAKGGE